MARKPKFEKLHIMLRRGGVMQFDTAYNAREAAKIATKRAREGWDVEVTPSATNRKLMTCTPSKRKAYWSDPDVKAHAICKMTPAFKKRVRGK